MAELSKRSAALASVGSGLLLTVLKVAVGLATGSLAIISEAAHSGLDLLAAALTFFVVYVAEQPPDENHPYGHGKAESLGALAESALLVATGVWVLWHAYERIFISPEIPQVTLWSFLVMVVSVIVDFLRARSLKRAARIHKSQALAADAAHFTNDMLGSLVVILSLGVLEIANRTEMIPVWLALRADAIGAALVAAIALRVAYGLGRTSIRDLMEDVPGDLGRRLTAQVRALAQLIPESVRIRVRFVGEQAFVDVAYQVPRSMSLEGSHQVSQHVRDVILHELPSADIMVGVEPARVESEEFAATIYATANRLGVAVHHLSLLLAQDGLKVLLDLELPSDLTLDQAHITSEQLRESLQRELPETAEINIHLEARDLHVLSAVQEEEVERTIMGILASLDGGSAVTKVTSYLVQSGTMLAVRCAYPPEMPLVEVHDRMANLEQQLRAHVPQVTRIHVDADPMPQG